jgi:hypothetical protein
MSASSTGDERAGVLTPEQYEAQTGGMNARSAVISAKAWLPAFARVGYVHK